eukprot:5731034-Prymnesium_polylepis.4
MVRLRICYGDDYGLATVTPSIRLPGACLERAQVSEGGGQPRDFVVADNQLLQRLQRKESYTDAIVTVSQRYDHADDQLLWCLQPSQRGGQLGEAAVVQQQLLKRVQVAEVLRHHPELVACEVEYAELRQLAQLLERRRRVARQRPVQRGPQTLDRQIARSLAVVGNRGVETCSAYSSSCSALTSPESIAPIVERTRSRFSSLQQPPTASRSARRSSTSRVA